jgi:Predicted membrane protein
MKDKFLSFLGLGSDVSLGLSLFAEFFCGLFVLFGLFTRLATIPIIINMGVATALAHNFDVFDTAEKPMLFLIGFLTLLITGPGRYSIDGMFRK